LFLADLRESRYIWWPSHDKAGKSPEFNEQI